MTHKEIREIVGDYTLLSEFEDDHSREVVFIEYADARQGFLREELDGQIIGPASDLWQLDEYPYAV